MSERFPYDPKGGDEPLVEAEVISNDWQVVDLRASANREEDNARVNSIGAKVCGGLSAAAITGLLMNRYAPGALEYVANAVAGGSAVAAAVYGLAMVVQRRKAGRLRNQADEIDAAIGGTVDESVREAL